MAGAQRAMLEVYFCLEPGRACAGGTAPRWPVSEGARRTWQSYRGPPPKMRQSKIVELYWPETTTTGVAPIVVADVPCKLYFSSSMHSTAARTTGKCLGAHPAITAFTAACSASASFSTRV